MSSVFIKNRLIEYREIVMEIETQLGRIEKVATKIIGLGSPTITDMPRNPSPNRDIKEELMDSKAEMEKRTHGTPYEEGA